jgi:geranylgeranyl pyrophosphate synthase
MNPPVIPFDEPSQLDSKLEWWFFHGRFCGEQVEERYFMASVFRTRLAKGNDHSADAFSAVISVLDPAAGRQSDSMRVDRSLIGALKRPNTHDEVDPFSPRAVADELRQYGVPREFECSEAEPSLSGDPLTFHWGDLRLASQPCGIELAFDEPGTGRPLWFELKPTAPRLVIDAARTIGEPEEAMQYAAWPVMRLGGIAGDLTIAGEGWFDHQWGGQAWFRNQDSPPRARGWDWLGFRLDDGSQGVLSTHTSTLAGPLWDLMGRDGKRWRAVFSFLLLDALGRDPEPVLDVMFVMPELLHNASLIIDDIQDDSALRRGQEAIHHRYGLDVAISAANTAYFLPLLLVQDHAVLTAAEKQATCEAYQRQLVQAHLGQSLDIFWTRSLSAAQLEGWMADSIGPKILQMYALKTAAPNEGLAEVAALLAGIGPAARQPVVRFAGSMGLAFQLIDDIKDFCSSPGWGKQPGEDLRTGKLTYLILRALERLAPPERGFLRDILCRPERRRDPDILNHGIELVRHSGACEEVREEARALVAPASETLSLRVPPSSSKTELRFLWESLVSVSMEDRDP